jgi:hypothetical protein
MTPRKDSALQLIQQEAPTQGDLFRMNAHGDIWQELSLFDESEPFTVTSCANEAREAMHAHRVDVILQWLRTPQLMPAPAQIGSYRSRRLAKADRLEGWAQLRQERRRSRPGRRA